MASQPPSRDPNAPRWQTPQERMRSQSTTDLQHQLDEALATIRRLTRDLKRERERHAETSEAYNKTVSNMVEIARENAMLSYELDRLKRHRSFEGEAAIAGMNLTPDEARLIRKAMARLHHPDVGGNEQRMKAWNAALDPLIDPE
jgi:chromosome segregation ATPase